MSPATDQVVVLAIAEQHVVAGHAVDEVVTGFAADGVAGADVVGRVCRVIPPTRCVVEQLDGAHHDLQRRVVAVVVEAQDSRLHLLHRCPPDG